MKKVEQYTTGLRPEDRDKWERAIAKIVAAYLKEKGK